MKKFIHVLCVAAVMFAAVGMTSCGEEGNEIVTPEEPEVVEMGHYVLSFEDIDVYHWPDSKEAIEQEYEAYKKTVIEALKLDTDKKYKWSEIEAEKDRLQKVFDGIKDFEYTVDAALNIVNYYGGITLKAYKEGKSEAAINFGQKKLKCLTTAPEGTTSQLYMVIESAEAAAPSAKEYCQKVRSLYADALKEVFTKDFDEVKGKDEMLNFYNLTNLSGDRDEVVKQIKDICDLVDLPALPDEVKQKAQEEFSKMRYLMKIDITSYDPYYHAPSKSDKQILTLTIGAK